MKKKSRRKSDYISENKKISCFDEIIDESICTNCLIWLKKKSKKRRITMKRLEATCLGAERVHETEKSNRKHSLLKIFQFHLISPFLIGASTSFEQICIPFEWTLNASLFTYIFIAFYNSAKLFFLNKKKKKNGQQYCRVGYRAHHYSSNFVFITPIHSFSDSL